MKLPLTMKDYLEIAKAHNMEVTDDVKGFIETFISIVNRAYYQGISEGRTLKGNNAEGCCKRSY